MTNYFYSASTGGFYTSDINPVMPSDVVEITEEYCQSLLQGQSEGLQIVADARGYPILITPVPVPPTAEQNKATASALLTGTDWTTIADVANPINSPYLANQDEFIAYRNEIRKIAVYPTAGDLVWATPPIEVWK
jgi:hypothetical protein